MSLPLPFVTAVSGVSFRPEAVALVEEGMPALVRREPDSPYDPNACAVEVNGQIVGHIPAAVAARLVGRAEESWTGEIVEKIGFGDKTGLRVRVTGDASQSGLVPNPRQGESSSAQPVPVTSLDSFPVEALGLPEANAVPVESSAPAVVAPKVGPEVRTRSRRVVGRLVERDETHLTVRTDQGALVRFPLELVVVDAE